jgi:hypothetical protein
LRLLKTYRHAGGCSLVLSRLPIRPSSRRACRLRGMIRFHGRFLSRGSLRLLSGLLVRRNPVASHEHANHLGGYVENQIVPVHRCQGTPAGEGSRKEVAKEHLCDVVSVAINNLGIRINAVDIYCLVVARGREKKSLRERMLIYS